MKIKYNYDNLVKRIDDCSPDNTIGYFLVGMGFECEDLLYRIVNAKEWTEEEIKKACALLNIPEEEINKYFYQVEDLPTEEEIKKSIEELKKKAKDDPEFTEVMKKLLSDMNDIEQAFLAVAETSKLANEMIEIYKKQVEEYENALTKMEQE